MTSAGTLSERAEAFLAADPRIRTFEVLEADSGLKVMVEGAECWFADRRAKACEALSSRILRQWRFVYERSYRGAHEGRAPNFDVWISGFTNGAIPIEAMQVWLDGVLNQLRGVPHKRVLDIGCGSGLVLAKLAPGGACYDGLDLSEEAISALSTWAASQETLRHVRLAQGAAHELSDREGEPVDLAVLNSVAQYFPDADYLIRVLEGAAAHVRPNGSIFLGDLRAPALLAMRAMNVAAARAPPGATAGEVRAKARRILEATGELSVDPSFFGVPGLCQSRLGHVQFALKPRATDRELAGYRYDALLRLDAPELAPAFVVELTTPEAIRRHLALEHPDAIAVLGLPNARLAGDVALVRAFEAASSETLVVTVKRSIGSLGAGSIEPEDLARAAAQAGYAVELRFTPGATDGRFDALIFRQGEAARWPEGPVFCPPTNDPLAIELAASLRRELQAELEMVLGGQKLAGFDLRFAPTAPSAPMHAQPLVGA